MDALYSTLDAFGVVKAVVLMVSYEYRLHIRPRCNPFINLFFLFFLFPEVREMNKSLRITNRQVGGWTGNVGELRQPLSPLFGVLLFRRAIMTEQTRVAFAGNSFIVRLWWSTSAC